MTQFIKLTHFQSSEPVWVNVAAIASYMIGCGTEQTTKISLSGAEPIHVRESPEEIGGLIVDPNRKAVRSSD